MHVRSDPKETASEALGSLANEATQELGEGGARDENAREDDARIARLFEMTSDLLATVSMDGRFTLLNPAWEQALGWTRE